MCDPTRFSPTGKTDAFGNKYVQRNDGRYYKTDGKSYWETPETKRIREAEEAQRQKKNAGSIHAGSGPTVGQIWDDGSKDWRM